MKKTVKQTLAAVVAVLAGIFSIGAGMGLYSVTFIPLWMPLAAAAVIALAVMPALLPRWQRLAGGIPAWAAGIGHLAVTGGVCFALILGANYFGASEPHEVAATVVGKEKKKHTRYRRAGRRNYVPAGDYYTWELVLELEGGRRYNKPVSAGRYRTVRMGSHTTVNVARGLFGFDVVK